MHEVLKARAAYKHYEAVWHVCSMVTQVLTTCNHNSIVVWLGYILSNINAPHFLWLYSVSLQCTHTTLLACIEKPSRFITLDSIM